MKLFWAVDEWKPGNGYGFSVHNQRMKQALIEAGVSITTDPDEPADLAVHIAATHAFIPVPGARNVFFTATEMSEPTTWRKSIAEAEALVLPSESSRQVCSRYFAGPTYVCPLGCDPNQVKYHERHAPEPGETWNILYVGNLGTCQGKGIDILLSAWNRFNYRLPENATLYIKTSDIPSPEIQHFIPSPTGLIPTSSKGRKSVTIDTRKLPFDELIKLYEDAHVFAFPSRGEGWGLVLTDSLASGLPSIWTHSSAMLDYANESIGYPITDFKMSMLFPAEIDEFTNHKPMRGAEADPETLIGKINEIIGNYPKALRRGRLASERMRSHYTWRQAAEKFIAICEQILVKEPVH